MLESKDNWIPLYGQKHTKPFSFVPKEQVWNGVRLSAG